MRLTFHSHMKNAAKMVCALALAIGLTATQASAGSATGSMSVSASVTTVCTITAGGSLAFVDSDLSANSDASQTMTIACTNSAAPISVSFNTGSNSGGSCDTASGGANANNRCLKSGSDYLAYQIYTTSGRSIIFGLTGTSTTAQTSTGAFTVFGRIPSGQTVPAGSGYADTLTATVNY